MKINSYYSYDQYLHQSNLLYSFQMHHLPWLHVDFDGVDPFEAQSVTEGVDDHDVSPDNMHCIRMKLSKQQEKQIFYPWSNDTRYFRLTLRSICKYLHRNCLIRDKFCLIFVTLELEFAMLITSATLLVVYHISQDDLTQDVNKLASLC